MARGASKIKPATQVVGGSTGTGGGTTTAPTLATLTLSNTQIAENSATNTVVGAVVNRTAGSSIALTGGTGINMFAYDAANNNIIVKGALDYETQTAWTIALTETLAGATGSPKVSTITINVTDVAEGTTGTTTTPLYTMDFVNGQYTGAALSAVQVVQSQSKAEMTSTGVLSSAFPANTPRVTDLGLAATANGADIVGKYSMTPDNWVNNKSQSVGKTVLATTADGFTPVLFNFYDSSDATGSSKTPGKVARNVTEGEVFTIVGRVKRPDTPRPAGSTSGMNIWIDFWDSAGANGVGRQMGIANIATPSTTIQQTFNPANISANTVATRTMSDGSVEMEIQVTVPAGKAQMQVSLGSYNWYDGTVSKPPDLVLMGLHVETGTKFNGWVATGATEVNQGGDVISLTGTLATPLTGAAGTIVVEFEGCKPPAVGATANILSAGTNDSIMIAAIDGFTSLKTAGGGSGKVAAYGLGGVEGITRVAYAKDATGWSMSVNEGKVIRSNTPLSISGTVHLFAGLNGRVRRLEGYNSRLDDASLKSLSSLRGKALPNSAYNKSYVPGLVASITFDDDFDTDSIKHRPTDTFSASNGVDMAHQYQAYPGKWIMRYVNHTAASGSNQAIGSPAPPSGQNPEQWINQEWEMYVDYDWSGWQVDGYTGPFSVTRNPGCMTIRGEYVDQATRPNLYALLPNRGSTGVKYQYLSGCLITAGYFKQKFGYFEARIKMPKGHTIWPAFWGLQAETAAGVENYWSETELDVVEFIGDNPTDTTGSYHANAYAKNLTVHYTKNVDFSQDFHTYAANWYAGKVDFYLDGKFMFQVDTTGSDFDSVPQYLLLNLAIGGSWPGAPDATTAAGSPYDMVIDWVRVLKTS